MILIAESGSTKTNWLNDKKELAQTIGLNPLFHNSEFIFNELMKHPQLVKDKEQYNKIFFMVPVAPAPTGNELLKLL